MTIAALDIFKPNAWNPNTMTEFERSSLRDGLKKDGWIVSQALLVWGKDEKGKLQNVIIDGEHRWDEARALGLKQGPVVVLNGLTAADAKKLTIKLDNKRGKFNQSKLRDVLLDLGGSGVEGLGFELGFDDDLFALMLDANPLLPPSDFKEVTIDTKTDYCCPKCGYEWSGASAPKKKQSVAKA